MHLKIVLFRRCRHMLLLSSLNKLLCVSCQESTEFTQPVTECEIKCCSSNCFHRARITGPRARGWGWVPMWLSDGEQAQRGGEILYSYLCSHCHSNIESHYFCSKMINFSGIRNWMLAWNSLDIVLYMAGALVRRYRHWLFAIVSDPILKHKKES